MRIRVTSLCTFILAFSGSLLGRVPSSENWYVAPLEKQRIELGTVTGIDAATAPVIEFIGYDGHKITEVPVIFPEKTAGADAVPFVEAALPEGYYDLRIRGENRPLTCGVISAPVPSREGDPFFGIDAAMTHLVKPDEREAPIAILGRYKVANVRERLRWERVQLSDGRFDWETVTKHDTIRRTYRRHGVPLLETFHQPPAWLNEHGSGLPDNLQQTADGWTEITKRWGSAWRALECWNEIDLEGDFPDEYLPAYRAVRYGVRRAGFNGPLIGGNIASFNKTFMETLARNELLHDVEAFSFHYYPSSLGLEKYIVRIRSWAKEAGRESVPLWLTETVGAWPQRPDDLRSPANHDRNRALELALSATESKACGIAAWFPFIYGNFPHGAAPDHGPGSLRNFGMTDRNWSPYRTMAAFLSVSRILAHSSYIGDLKTDHPQTRRSRVFMLNSQASVVVLHTGNPSQVTLPVTPRRVQGIDGRDLPITRDRLVPVPDGLSYVQVNTTDIQPFLKTDTLAMRLLKIAGQDSGPIRPASPLIIAAKLDPQKISRTVTGYLINPGVEQIEMSVSVSNLSDTKVTVPIHVANGPTGSSAKNIFGQTLTLPPRTTEKLPIRIILSELTSNAFGQTNITVSGHIGKSAEHADPTDQTGSVYLPVNLPRSLQEYLSLFGYKVRIPIGDTALWTSKTSGTAKITANQTSGFTVTATFPESLNFRARWNYPQISLPPGINRNRVSGIVIRASCDRPSWVRFITENSRGVRSLTTTPIIRSDGRWHTVYIPLESFVNPPDGDNVSLAGELHVLGIGFNAVETKTTLQISDVWFVGN